MSGASKIEWTDATWNPVTGCTKVSQGCKHCYAERFAERFRGVPNHPFEQGFDLRIWPERLTLPLNWTGPRRVFVNSMSDLYHPEVPTTFIRSVFDVMVEASRHTFQILTKRAERLLEISSKLPWPNNVWQGVSVEDERVVGRIGLLRAVPAKVRFLSLEPLIGPLPDLDLEGIHWVIVGGESGAYARPMDPAWVREIRATCQDQGVPFFFKQWGGVHKSRAGRVLDGRTWDEYPQAQAVPA